MRQRPDIQVSRFGQDKAKEHDGVCVREAGQETCQFAVVMDCLHTNQIKNPILKKLYTYYLPPYSFLPLSDERHLFQVVL